MTPPGDGPVLKPTREPVEKPAPRPKGPPAPPPPPPPPRLPDPRPPAPPPVDEPVDRGPVMKPRPGGHKVPLELPPAVKLTGPIAKRWRDEGGESWAQPWEGVVSFTGGAYARFLHRGTPQRFSLILWRPERGALLLTPMMYEVYHATGGAQGPLGYPTSERMQTHDHVGWYQVFDGGVVVWHPDTGAAAVYGAIHAAYHRVHGSHFGYPLGEQTLTPDRQAWVQQFRNLDQGTDVSIYWTAAHDAHPLSGAIREAWLSYRGGTTLGYPTTDEMDAAGGGRWQRFEHADYIWHADTGAHEVHGDIGAVYHSVGGSAWGFPTTDESAAANGGRFNHFRLADGSDGSIYWTPDTGAHPVTGPIRQRWSGLGWEHSHLGFPTGPAAPWAAGGTNALEQPYQGGRMLYRDDLALAGPDPIDLLHDFGKSSQLQGWVRARVFSDTRVEFTGHQRATGENSYSFGIQVAVTDGLTGVAAAWQDEVAGTFESGSRNAEWSEPGTLTSAAMFWDLQRGGLDVRRFKDKSLGWVSGVLEGGLKFLIGSGSGFVLGPGGLALAVVGALAGAIATGGNFTGGLRVIGGTLWLFGPAGTLIALGAEGLYQLMTDERPPNDQEWEVAREVFGAALPPRDDIRITDALGAGGRPFVFKRFDGTVCVNVGRDWYDDPMGMMEGDFRNGVDNSAGTFVRGEKLVHELVHVWQLEHGSDLLLVLQGMAKVFGEEYDYTVGKDFADYNLEQQAHLVQDWFARHYTPNPPAGVNHFDHGLASANATNPLTDDLWHYVRDNIRSGSGSAL